MAISKKVPEKTMEIKRPSNLNESSSAIAIRPATEEKTIEKLMPIATALIATAEDSRNRA